MYDYPVGVLVLLKMKYMLINAETVVFAFISQKHSFEDVGELLFHRWYQLLCSTSRRRMCKQRLGTHLPKNTKSEMKFENSSFLMYCIHKYCIYSVRLRWNHFFLHQNIQYKRLHPCFFFSLTGKKVCTHIIRCHEQLFWHSKLEDCFGRIF